MSRLSPLQQHFLLPPVCQTCLSPLSQPRCPVSLGRFVWFPPSAARTYAHEVQGHYRVQQQTKPQGQLGRVPILVTSTTLNRVHLSEQGERAHPAAIEHPTHPTQSSPPQTEVLVHRGWWKFISQHNYLNLYIPGKWNFIYPRSVGFSSLLIIPEYSGLSCAGRFRCWSAFVHTVLIKQGCGKVCR